MKRLLIALAAAAVVSATFAKVTIQQGFEDNTNALAATPTTSALAAMDGDGTAENPYKIATANDLIALMDAVSNNAAARSLNYIQTADIDMASVGPFAGIGKYDANPTGGTPFTGTYDGQGYKISDSLKQNLVNQY